MLAATIDRLWDGARARAGEVVGLSATRQGAALRVEIDAPFHDDPAPSPPAGRCPGLWEHEVVELFLVGPDEGYLELEFGPHGHFLALQFAGRRRLVTDLLEVDDYRVESHGPRWRGFATLPIAWLPEPVNRWNAFAIHGSAEERRYLAAHPVPGDRPDFHRIDRFPAI